MLLRRRAATAAAATGLGLTRRRSEAEAKPAPHVTGVLVLFRHGARSPVWKLPDEDGQIYETITAAPAHAASVVVHDAVRAPRPHALRYLNHLPDLSSRVHAY